MRSLAWVDDQIPPTDARLLGRLHLSAELLCHLPHLHTPGKATRRRQPAYIEAMVPWVGWGASPRHARTWPATSWSWGLLACAS